MVEYFSKIKNLSFSYYFWTEIQSYRDKICEILRNYSEFRVTEFCTIRGIFTISVQHTECTGVKKAYRIPY
jgi:hypothetical protein